MSDRRAILDAVATIARQALDRDTPLAPEQRLVEDLALDSVELLTLAVEVEDHFRICLDEDDEAAIVTVGDLVTVILEKSLEKTGREETRSLEQMETP